MAKWCKAALAAMLVGVVGVATEYASGPASRPDTQGAPTTQPTSRPASRAIIVATYNINILNRDLKAVTETIRKSKADLVCLQETNEASALHFKANLRDEYPHMDFHNYAGGGLGFLAKKQFKTLKYLPAKYGVHSAWIVRITIDDKPIEVAAVHLQPTVPRADEGVAELIARWLATEEIRAKEIAYIHENLSGRLPVVILGDFNSSSRMQAPRFLSQKGFVDSFASVTEKPDDRPTWKLRSAELRLARRIDYIFHTKDFTTGESRIVDSEGSDHYLLASELAWAERKPGQD